MNLHPFVFRILHFVLGILLFSGCASDESSDSSKAAPRKDIDDVLIQVAQLKDQQLQLYRELVDKVNRLDRDLEAMKAQMMVVKNRLDHVESARREGEVGPPMVHQDDAIARASNVLAKLKAAEQDVDAAVAELKPFARMAAPLVVDELRKNVADLVYATRLETVLSRLPLEDVRVPLTQALRDPRVRMSAARMIGALGDKETSKSLEEFAADNDEDFRLVVGEALVRCKNRAGVPFLLQALKSEKWDNRSIAIGILKSIHKGEDFGYRAFQDVAANADAIRLWMEWWDQVKAALFE